MASINPEGSSPSQLESKKRMIRYYLEQTLQMYQLDAESGFHLEFNLHGMLQDPEIEGDSFVILDRTTNRLRIPKFEEPNFQSVKDATLMWLFEVTNISRSPSSGRAIFFEAIEELTIRDDDAIEKLEEKFDMPLCKIMELNVRVLMVENCENAHLQPMIVRFSNTVLVHDMNSKDEMKNYIGRWAQLHQDSNVEGIAENERECRRQIPIWFKEISDVYNLHPQIHALSGEQFTIYVHECSTIGFTEGIVSIPMLQSKRELKLQLLFKLFSNTKVKKTSECTTWFQQILMADNEILYCIEELTSLKYEKLKRFSIRETIALPNMNAPDVKILSSIRTLLIPQVFNSDELQSLLKNWIALSHEPQRTISAASCSSLDLNDHPLPEGWEVRTDSNGRPFYINHTDRYTQSERPTDSTELGQMTETAMTNLFQSRSISNPTGNDIDDGVEDMPEVEDWLAIFRGETNANSESVSPSAPPEEIIDEESQMTTVYMPEIMNYELSLIQRGENENRIGLPDEDDGASEPLPPGWEMRRKPSGRIFFINHSDKTTTWIDPRTESVSKLQEVEERSPNSTFRPLPDGWEERETDSGNIFYVDHENKITTWQDPRLNTPDNSEEVPIYSKSYKEKYRMFLKTLTTLKSSSSKRFEIPVRRPNLLQDSLEAVMADPGILRNRLWIKFEGESGLDYGGVSREWFSLVSKEIFNPYYGLFEYSASDNYTLQINPNSALCIENHLRYFHFIGRIAGMAVFHKRLLDGFFIQPFYKMMLYEPVTLRDMEQVDIEYYNSLKWIKENDPACLELTFVAESEVFGQIVENQLKPGGANIPVNNENKLEYIDLVIKERFNSRIKSQMESFLEGFNNVIPLKKLKMFDAGELELLLGGVGSINVDDWRKNTLYKGGYHEDHQVICWFWNLVTTFGDEMRSRLLQFTTGTSRVPMNGFKVKIYQNFY